MGFTKTRIALVGSGATGLAFWWGLCDSDATIELTLFEGLENLAPKIPIHQENSEFLNTKTKQDALSIPEQIKTVSSLKNHLAGSYLAGGWTSIWGATMLPWHFSAYASWGLNSTKMISALEEITSRIPVMSSIDYLTESFKMNLKHFNLRPDTFLYTEMLKRISPSNLLTFGSSRLAISPIASTSDVGCIKCGLCLKGCPFDHIWSAKSEWDELRADVTEKSFSRVAGLVKSIMHSPESRSWSLKYLDSDLAEEKIEEFDIVVLASGSLSTASILINSNLFEEVIIKDSPLTIVPFFLDKLKVIGGLESRITLSEVFIVGNTSLPIEEHIYMQAYGGSNEILERIMLRYKFLRFVPRKVLNAFVKRIGVAMIFQGGNFGGEISVHLSENMIRIDESKEKSAEGRQKLKLFLRKIRRQGVHFLWAFRYEAEVGEGYHFGASIPMGEMKLVDYSGEFKSAPGLYCVDTSVLPMVSCYPITLTAMANAFRIGKELGEKYESE